MFPVNVISSEPFDKLRINSVRERIPGNLRLPWQNLASLIVALMNTKFASQT